MVIIREGKPLIQSHAATTNWQSQDSNPRLSDPKSHTFLRHNPSSWDRRRPSLFLPFSPVPSCPQAQVPLHAPPWSRLGSFASLRSQLGHILSSVPLKRARASKWRAKRVCSRLGHPVHSALRDSFLSACHGDRDQPRPGVPGDCLPEACPDTPQGRPPSPESGVTSNKGMGSQE